MDDFRKDLSSTTTPIKPSAIPRISSTSDLKQKITSRKEVNENEAEIQNQMGSKLQNPKKPSMTKHFMSPTISAASKATTPRKKILMERNEASGSVFSDTQVQKSTQNIESGVSANLGLEYSSHITPLSPKITESEENGIDSVSHPYDPLTNYLSPRPKFLRYNPNRRLEILHRRESELKQGGKDGLVINQSASLEPEKVVEDEAPSDASSSQEDGSSLCNDELETNNTSENEEFDESESEFEEDEEEFEEERKGWNLNQVLKFLLLLGVLAFSTFYISFMNSPNHHPSLQALLYLKEGYQRFQNSIFQSGLDNSVLWDTNQELLMEATERGNYEGIKKEETVEDAMEKPEEISDQIDEISELSEGEKEEMVEEAMEKPEEISDQIDEISELSEGEKNQDLMEDTERVEDEEIKKEELVGEELEQPGEISNQVDEILEMNEGEAAEISKLLQVSQNQFMRDTVDYTDVVGEKSRTEIEVNSDKENQNEVEVSEDESTSQIEQEEDEASESRKLNQLPTEKVNGVEIVEEMLEDEMEKTVAVTDGGHEETAAISETSEVPQTQFTDDDQNMRSEIPTISETEFASEREQTEFMKAVSMAELAVEISILSVIVASSVLGFLHIKRRKPSSKDASPTTKPSVESIPPKKRDTTIEEKIEKAKKLNLPKKEEAFVVQIEKVDSFIPSSSVHSGGKVSKNLYRSRVLPTVELLGEFMVEESGSSLKSCSLLKSKTIGGEESNFSVSISEKKSRSKRTSSVNQDYSSLSKFSCSESPSYGSFTTQENIIRKEEGKDGEGIVKIVTTPVRRSSRIRSKSVMSP